MKIGIDLGGTKTEGILIDNTGKELSRHRIKTEKNYEGTIQGIISIVKKFENDFGNSESVGIGMPGAVSSNSALVKNANSIWLNGKPFKKDLEKKLEKVVHLENDANCFTLSEAVDGAGKNHNLVFGVIIGTGTGGGIVIDKKIIRGKNLIVGEFGHNSLPRTSDNEIKLAKPCYCGLSGCIETFISGPGFEYIFNNTNNTNYKTKEIVKLYNEDDVRAIKAFDDYVDRLARALSDVINLLDPDVIVLGGGMSNIEYIYQNIHQKLSKYVFSDVLNTKVMKNAHGDSSGVRGAAWLSD